MSKKQPKLTPWFPGSVKPARKGVYERKDGINLRCYAKWNGSKWMSYKWTVLEADVSTYETLWPNLKWRGLAEKPKAVKP